MEFLCKGTSCQSRPCVSVKKQRDSLVVLRLAVLPFSMRRGRGQAVRDVLYRSLRGSACINYENLAD